MRRFVVAAACSSALFAALAPARSQTLRIALREDPDILDPTLARSYVGRIVFAGLCDKLFDLNEKLEIVPRLATSHEWTDPKTLVLHLRQGVTFQNGEPFDAAAVKADPRLRIVTSPALGYEGITFNIANGDRSKAPIDQSALLRQAFESAIDRQVPVDVVFSGIYTPNAQPVSPASPFHSPDLAPRPRDLARTRALVKQAGTPTPISVSMNVPNTPDRAQLAEVIRSMVREAGFELKINLIEFASSLSAATQGAFETYLIGWSGRADPDGNLYAFLHTGSGQNDGHYANPVVDDTLEQARQAADIPARRALYARMWEQQRKDLPLIYLFTPVNVVGLSAKLSGFRAVPDGMIRLQGLRLEK